MATAKKRQALPVLPIEVARDAVRLGRPPAEIAAAAGDDPARLALGLELVRAGMELLAGEGAITCNGTMVDDSRRLTLSFDDVDRLRSVHAKVPEASPLTWTTYSGGEYLRSEAPGALALNGPTIQRCARKVDGRNCTGENGHDGDHTFDGGNS